MTSGLALNYTGVIGPCTRVVTNTLPVNVEITVSPRLTTTV